MQLLAADRVRFGGRHDVWLVVALVPVVLILMFVAEFNSVTTRPQDEFFIDPPDAALEAQLREQTLADWRARLTEQLPTFTFPASLVKVAGNIVPIILLSMYLGTALIAGEFEWGTVRTLHLTSPRGPTLAVRIGVVVALVALATGIALAVTSILPFTLVVEGQRLQSFGRGTANLIPELGIRLLAVLPFIAIPAFLAVLSRSIGATFVLTVLAFVTDLAVSGIPFWPSSPVPWLPAVTISGSISRLVAGPESPLAAVAPGSVSLAALLAWSILPAAAAVALFRRLDLEE